MRGRLTDRLPIAHLPNFTVSFGLASSDQADEFQQVVSLADEALLAAKAGGRDQIVVASRGGAARGRRQDDAQPGRPALASGGSVNPTVPKSSAAEPL